MKKITAYLLIFAIIFSACPSFNVYAAYLLTKGTCGESVIWTLDSDGTLAISGSGKMENYSGAFYTPWYEYQDKIINVEIESGVTSVGDYSFDYCQNLTGAVLPDTVTHIGTSAFSSTGITDITIPAGVQSIGDWAFSGSELANLVIPESVTDIGSYAFNCTPLKSVTVPSTVKSLGQGVFNSSGITNAIIGCDLPTDAFWKCSDLTNVTLLDGVTTIGVQAFMECENLTSVTIPLSVTNIKQSAFTWVKSLTDIYYAGTEEQWNLISIESYNDYLSNVSKHFGEKSGYIIKYDYLTNGGITAGKNMDVVSEQNPVDLTVSAVKEGWEFVGWNTDPESESALSEHIAVGDVTLFAIYKKDISAYFYSTDNTLQTVQTTTIYNNATTGIITAPSPSPYNEWTGVGWRDDTAALSEEYAISKKIYVTNDIYLYAVYSRDLTLSYNANGGNSTPPAQTELQYYNAYGNKQVKSFTLASAISKDNDVFYKWAKGSVTGVTYGAGEEIAITDDTTMYATWSEIPAVNSPVISVSDVTGGKSVSISCSTSDAAIYYTTDGTTPTTGSNIYSAPLVFTSAGKTEIGAIAVKSGYTCSSVTAETVIVEKAATPVPSVIGGTITEAVDIELTCSTSGAEIYYTTDGTVPTVSSTKYDGKISISETKTLKAIAVAQGYADSECMAYTYTYQEPEVGIPSVTTCDAVEITKNSATLSAVVDSDGGSAVISRQFVYWNKYDPLVKYTVTADSDFNATLKNLSSDSTYYYYAKAANSVGTGTGLIKSFDTASEDSPQSVSVSPAYVSLGVDETYQLLATVLPASASNRNVVWSTSDNSIVTVDNSGKIKGIKRGTATITATTEEGRLKAACTVDVGGGIIDGTFDFSEWNMTSNTSNFAEDGFDWDTSNGGNSTIATAYLARWDGAVLESNDVYPSYNGYPQELYYEKKADYHVQEVLWLPDRKDFSDNAEIKNAILKYGAVSASYLSNNYYYSNNYLNYYHPADTSDSGNGHAIAIVGWDDNYSADNFKISPPGNGAFICKNSWGTGYGDEGYFYISYYDKHIGVRGTMAVLTSLERNTNYNTIYQYDPLGAVGAYGYKNSTYAANVFPQSGNALSKNELLKAVSFYTYYKNTSYEVYVVKNYKNKSSLSKSGEAVASGIIQDSGYHTVTLDSSISLSAGTRFAIIVKLSVPGEYSYVYYEYPLENYSGNARANSDEGYISSSGTSWTDFTSIISNANLCIKAFTDNQSTDSAVLFSAIDNDSRTYSSDKVYTLENVLEEGIKISDEYVEYVQKKNNSVDFFSETEENPTGDIPNVIDIGTNTVSFVDGAILPSSYDLREENSVTSVRNQGSWGTCWAHAMYASLESVLLKKSRTLDTTSCGDAASDNYIADINQSGISPTGLTLSDDSILMAVGSEYRLYADITPKNATEKGVIWSSDNEDVAIVDTNGQITALKTGNAVITCTALNGNYTAQCEVQVTESEEVSSIMLEYESVTKSVGDVFLIDYVINPSTAAGHEVSWSSDNPNIVAVNENGLMTALSVGTATVTVETKDGNKTDSVSITVNDGMDFEITDLTTDFSKYDNHLFGSADVVIDNRTADNKISGVILAVYDASGRMIMMKQKEETLSAGKNTVTFNNLFLENISGSGCKIKSFIWSGLFSLAPASTAAEKSLE